jgi:hypothetical protein
VTVEPPSGWDAASYGEPIATDVEPILLPWGAVRSQVFRFDGSRFSKAKEVMQKESAAPVARPAREPGSPDDTSHPAMIHPPEPPTPKVTRGSEAPPSSAQVLDQYRRDRAVASGTTLKVDLQVQVTGDPRPERVVLIGRDIVVLGPGIKDGTGYNFTTLQQFADPSDIRDLSARDLTGDGAADLVVRGVRHLTATDGNTPHGAARVDVEVMFVYEVKDDAITRVFGIETAREHKGKRVQGMVQFIPAPGGKAFDILSAPGRATGWNAKTYPWAQDRPGDGSLEPLLLPWGGIGSVRYTWNGSQFVRSGGS